MNKYIFFAIILCVSCKKNNPNNEVVKKETTNTVSFFEDKFNNRVQMDSLRNKILLHGDTLAYRQARKIYI